jgi:hypothetical protein
MHFSRQKTDFAQFAPANRADDAIHKKHLTKKSKGFNG